MRWGTLMTGFALSRICGAFTAALLLAGPLGGAAPAAAEKVLRIANMGEPESLDPHKTSTTGESRILRQLFEGLLVHDPKANVAPGAAESRSEEHTSELQSPMYLVCRLLLE